MESSGSQSRRGRWAGVVAVASVLCGLVLWAFPVAAVAAGCPAPKVSGTTATCEYTGTTGPTGTIQKFTVPEGVTSVTIEAEGAQGGESGGKGAILTATLPVSGGELLNVLVGGAGASCSCRGGGGGGGGSFVYSAASAKGLLLAAAGGGGSGGGGAPETGIAGGATESASEGHPSGEAGAAGTDGGGGGVAAFGKDVGAGGGGLLTKGAGVDFAEGGKALTEGGEGGGPAGFAGGFGGGGGGEGNGGGGGGGYNGGGGGGDQGAGGGGGSYSESTPVIAESGVREGNGLVVITYTVVPTSKDQCKEDGWKSYGTMFKNQGQCVSFVATGG